MRPDGLAISTPIVLLVTVLTTLPGQGAATALPLPSPGGASQPEAVSPGEADRAAPTRDGCPLFIWVPVNDADAYELAVHRAEMASAATEPVLEQSVPATLSWTPAFDRCLAHGRYAWVVRARTPSGWSVWSEPKFFAVPDARVSPEVRTPHEVGETPATRQAPREAALEPGRSARFGGSGEGPRALFDEASPPIPCQAGQEVFTDVPASSVFCAAIQRLYAEQLTSGCATGPLRFCPDGPVSRQQLALILYRAVHAKDALQIDAGLFYTCGLKSDGRVVCWGDNGEGQVSPVPAGTYSQVSAGNFHSCGLQTNGTVICWGDNVSGQVSPVSAGTYSQVSAGGNHSCGLQTNGTVVCWGQNSSGQVSPVPAGTYSQVSAGSSHSCGLQTNGTVICWGSNGSGQVSPVPAETYAQVSAGNLHSCGLQSNGTVICWGANTLGQVSPVPAGAYSQVSAGALHTCGLQTHATVICWGTNGSGQVSPVPAGTYSQVSAANNHNCGLQTNGTVVCWGSNSADQAVPPPWFP